MPAPTHQQSWFAFTHPPEKILPPLWWQEIYGVRGRALRCEHCKMIDLSDCRVLHAGQLLCPECLAIAKAKEN